MQYATAANKLHRFVNLDGPHRIEGRVSIDTMAHYALRESWPVVSQRYRRSTLRFGHVGSVGPTTNRHTLTRTAYEADQP